MAKTVEIESGKFGRLLEAAAFRDYYVRTAILPGLEDVLRLLEADPAYARWKLDRVIKDLSESLAKEGYYQE
jgi:hypothetical protein